ncbi:MAG TPA: TetR/AcrR family transcriptional regulator [Sphingomicrobium sp.]|nr:TetR/AcrR family transcriptional regulator [Sphingomicrobium sp.]
MVTKRAAGAPAQGKEPLFDLGASTLASPSAASEGKAPRTQRGEKTLRKILDAAVTEFGARGFSDSSIVGITTRAEVALGTFYTYFDSKDAVFAALVRDMSGRVRDAVAPAIEGGSDALNTEARALAAYLGFVAEHEEVYRIINEAEFVDPEGFRIHYMTTAKRIAARLAAGTARGEVSAADPLASEVRAWAVMGMNVFLGLRFGVWGREDPHTVARHANNLLRDGLKG